MCRSGVRNLAMDSSTPEHSDCVAPTGGTRPGFPGGHSTQPFSQRETTAEPSPAPAAPCPRAGAVVPQEPEAPEAKPAECEANCAHHRPVRLSWAKLLKRVFDLDLEHCPNCGGELKIIAAILEQPVIEKILTRSERFQARSKQQRFYGFAGACRQKAFGSPRHLRPMNLGLLVRFRFGWRRLRSVRSQSLPVGVREVGAIKLTITSAHSGGPSVSYARSSCPLPRDRASSLRERPLPRTATGSSRPR
jgi:hypothetical protein